MAEGNGDGRLLARLDERTEAMAKDLVEIKEFLRAHDTRIRNLEVEQGEMRTTVRNWGVGNLFAAVVAAITGVTVKG